MVSRVPKSITLEHKLMGFFDGESQASSNLCGAGAIIRLTDHNFFFLNKNKDGI